MIQSSRRTQLTLFVSLIAVLVMTTTAFSGSTTNKGSNPNGKPFVELNGAIIEVEGEISTLKDQVDALVGQVDTLEGRVTANEAAIANLLATNIDLQLSIDANAADIASLEAQITDLESENVSLQAQIDANGDADGSLQAVVAANEALITTLTQSVSDMETSLQDQIDNNEQLITLMEEDISAIQQALEMKQNRVDGLCPDGSAIQAVLEDGSVTCESGGTLEGGLETTQVWGYNQYGGGYYNYGYAEATCPAGYAMTGCGFYSYDGWAITNYIYKGWNYETQSYERDICAAYGYSYYGSWWTQAQCMRVAP